MTELPAIEIVGRPYGKGSFNVMPGRGGRANFVPQADFELNRWTGKVRDAAVDFWGRPMFATPVVVTLLFRCPVPSLHYHEKDVDKLVRAVLDALTRAGTYKDDKYVSTVLAHKLHVGPLAPTFGLRMQIALLEDSRDAIESWLEAIRAVMPFTNPAEV